LADERRSPLESLGGSERNSRKRKNARSLGETRGAPQKKKAKLAKEGISNFEKELHKAYEESEKGTGDLTQRRVPDYDLAELCQGRNGLGINVLI